MDMNDGDEQTRSAKLSPAMSAAPDNEVHTLKTLTVKHSGLMWADLEVDYWWSGSGDRFYCEAKRYRVINAGGNKGNVELGFHSVSGWGWNELTNDNAIQDGQWHAISGGGSVPGDATTGYLSFRYTWDFSGNDPKEEITKDVAFQLSPPVVNPIGAVTNRIFEVSGLGVAGAVLNVYNANGSEVGGAHVKDTGLWAVEVEMSEPLTEMSIYARQQVNHNQSNPSNTEAVTLLFSTITAPVENATVRIEQLAFSGTCTRNANIGVVLAGDHYTPLSEGGAVPSGNWSRALLPTFMWPSDILEVKAQWSLGVHGYSDIRKFKVESFPLIGTPDTNLEHNTPLTFTGRGGRPGATVFIRQDANAGTVYGSAAVTSNNWSVIANIPPGQHTVVAEQSMGGVKSGGGLPHTYRIKPPAIREATARVDGQSHVTFSGVGHLGAEVDIHVTGNSTPVASVKVTGATWSTVVADWLPASAVVIDFRQRVADNVGGWIYSDWGTRLSLDVPVPPPTLSVEVGADGKPRFFGTGKLWPNQPASRVEVRLNNTSTPIVPPVSVGAGGTWSSAATEAWLPGSYNVVAQLTFEGKTSLWTDPIEVKIAPPAPTIDPVAEDGLSPLFSGTCLNAATVRLTFSDAAQTEHDATVTQTTWSFTRPTPFAEGVSHSITAIQTVGGQASLPATRTFTVWLPMLKPTISQPQDGDEVDSDITVHGGNGMAGAVMQVRDAQFQRPLGEPKILAADGAWAIELKGLELRPYTIDAQQIRHERPSPRSDYRDFTVVVLPPQFELPTPGGDVPRTATFAGSGRVNGRVSAWLDGDDTPLLDNVLIDAQGRWSATVTLPVGKKTLRATQTFGGQTSKPQQLEFNVVPAAPVIESPNDAEHVGAQLVVSGFGYPGDTITVARGAKQLGRTPVLADRTWSLNAVMVPADGPSTLSAVASSEGFASAAAERVIMIGLFLPSITSPAEGQWLAPGVELAGQGAPGTGTLVAWYSPDEIYARALPVTAQGWATAALSDLPEGGQWARFQQTVSGGAAVLSDWAQSPRFEVLPQDRE